MNAHRNAAIALALLASSACFAASDRADSSAEPAAESLVSTGSAMLTAALPESPVMLAALPHRRKLDLEMKPLPRRASFQPETLPEAPDATAVLIETVDNMPILGTLHRRAGRRLNTTDSSHPDDFAVCYRLNRRMGLQVIPGDPAPVKLPVSTMANNEGVTLGMTWKLSR